MGETRSCFPPTPFTARGKSPGSARACLLGLVGPVVLRGVLRISGLAVAHRILEVLDAFAESLSELRDLAGSEDEDDDHENDEKFGKSEVRHGTLLPAGSYSPRLLSEEGEKGTEGPFGRRVAADDPARRLAVRAIERPAHEHHLLE